MNRFLCMSFIDSNVKKLGYIEHLLIMSCFFLLPATKLGQGYVFTHVCDSVHDGGGSPPLNAVIHPPGPEAGTPPAQCMLGDTGNKRAVRILLECNLVLHLFYSL